MVVITKLLVVSAYGHPTTEAAVDVDRFLETKCNPGDLKCNKINEITKKMQIIKMKCDSRRLICRHQNYLSALNSRTLEGFDLQPITTDTTIGNLHSDILNRTIRFFQGIASSTQKFQPDDHTRLIVSIVNLTSKAVIKPIPEFQPTTSVSDTNIGNIHSDMDDHNNVIDTKCKKQPMGEIILLFVCGILVGLWVARRRAVRYKRRQQNMYQ